MTKPVLFMFGGVSAEHEVSVVTGLQALERVDRARYEPLVVYVTKKGETLLVRNVKERGDFLSARKIPVSFGRDSRGGYVEIKGWFGKRVYPYAAYFAFHGGSGEGGPLAGLCESVGIPHTASTVEGSVIVMNKRLTKEVLRENDVPVLPDMRVFSDEVRKDPELSAKRITGVLSLPVIVKPVHLGSSIGIKVAHTDVELQKALIEAAFSDNEILAEPFLVGITEYNCAVRRIGERIETSEIEKPVPHDAILSFADKYERGGKKTGAGMASLSRELPAKISPELKEKIQEIAKKAFAVCRLKGMARIDFMQGSESALYLTEINPIPGSMAFYLWEASGIPFRDQISDLIEQAVVDARASDAFRLDYASDIIERFVKNRKS